MLFRSRVVPVGMDAPTITLRYVAPPAGAAAIAPCTGESACRRAVFANVPLQVTAQSGRRTGTITVTPARDGEEIRVTATSRRPAAPTGERPSTAASRNGRPCSRINPSTGLMEVCFD